MVRVAMHQKCSCGPPHTRPHRLLALWITLVVDKLAYAPVLSEMLIFNLFCCLAGLQRYLLAALSTEFRWWLGHRCHFWGIWVRLVDETTPVVIAILRKSI